MKIQIYNLKKKICGSKLALHKLREDFTFSCHRSTSDYFSNRSARITDVVKRTAKASSESDAKLV